MKLPRFISSADFFERALLALAILSLILFLFGCKQLNPPIDPSGSSHLTKTPKSLVTTDKALTWLIVFSVVGVGAGAMLFFLAPPAHVFSLPIAGGSGAVLGLSLCLKTTLWMIPWVAGGLLIVGAVIFAVEFYVKLRKTTPAQIAVQAIPSV